MISTLHATWQGHPVVDGRIVVVDIPKIKKEYEKLKFVNLINKDLPFDCYAPENDPLYRKANFFSLPTEILLVISDYVGTRDPHNFGENLKSFGQTNQKMRLLIGSKRFRTKYRKIQIKLGRTITIHIMELPYSRIMTRKPSWQIKRTFALTESEFIHFMALRDFTYCVIEVQVADFDRPAFDILSNIFVSDFCPQVSIKLGGCTQPFLLHDFLASLKPMELEFTGYFDRRLMSDDMIPVCVRSLRIEEKDYWQSGSNQGPSRPISVCEKSQLTIATFDNIIHLWTENQEEEDEMRQRFVYECSTLPDAERYSQMILPKELVIDIDGCQESVTFFDINALVQLVISSGVTKPPPTRRAINISYITEYMQKELLFCNIVEPVASTSDAKQPVEEFDSSPLTECLIYALLYAFSMPNLSNPNETDHEKMLRIGNMRNFTPNPPHWGEYEMMTDATKRFPQHDILRKAKLPLPKYQAPFVKKEERITVGATYQRNIRLPWPYMTTRPADDEFIATKFGVVWHVYAPKVEKFVLPPQK